MQFVVFITKSNEIVPPGLFQTSSNNICFLLFVVCLSSIVIMAAKRVSSKSVESFDETFNIFYSKSERLYTEIDNWSARINSLLELDIKKKRLLFLRSFQVLGILQFSFGRI